MYCLFDMYECYVIFLNIYKYRYMYMFVVNMYIDFLKILIYNIESEVFFIFFNDSDWYVNL